MRKLVFFLCTILCPIGATVLAGIEQAPPSFDYNGRKAVFIDFTDSDLTLNYDVSSQKATARAVISFYAKEAGFPIFDLVPKISHLVLNGETLSPNKVPTISDPDRVTRFRVIQKEVEAETQNTLEIEYAIDSSDVTFTGGGVRMGFWMSDLTSGGRRFWEQYAPSNYEFDQFQQDVTINIINGRAEQIIFANGDIEELVEASWKIHFPSYHTTSSYFLHITDKSQFAVRKTTYQGLEREIPVVSYSSSGSRADSGLRNAKRYLQELESTYGPYAHKYNISYIAGNGGMEYAGATMTGLGAQGHEFTHLWFARSVMPSKANSGWIDEAIASWRGNGYPRRTFSNRSSVNLGGFSPYRRHTTSAAYSQGATLIAEFDGEFRELGGMKTLLSLFFEENKNTTITVSQFKKFLEKQTGRDLQRVRSHGKNRHPGRYRNMVCI